jgi:lipopolysaccharide assembly protein A
VRIVYRALVLIGALVLILLAVSNREMVSLTLWPLPFLVDLPLYLVFFVSLLVGLLIGASAAWIAGGRLRRELRRRRRRIEALERELAATQASLKIGGKRQH